LQTPPNWINTTILHAHGVALRVCVSNLPVEKLRRGCEFQRIRWVRGRRKRAAYAALSRNLYGVKKLF